MKSKSNKKQRSARYLFYSAGKIFVAEGTRLSEYKDSLRRRVMIKTAITGNPR